MLVGRDATALQLPRHLRTKHRRLHSLRWLGRTQLQTEGTRFGTLHVGTGTSLRHCHRPSAEGHSEKEHRKNGGRTAPMPGADIRQRREARQTLGGTRLCTRSRTEGDERHLGSLRRIQETPREVWLRLPQRHQAFRQRDSAIDMLRRHGFGKPHKISGGCILCQRQHAVGDSVYAYYTKLERQRYEDCTELPVACRKDIDKNR